MLYKWEYGLGSFRFEDLENFEKKCLKCGYLDYKHSTIIFNTFIWCQFFNEYNARKILNEWNMFDGIQNNPMFLYVSLFTAGAQIFLVEVGGKIVSTTHLDAVQWIICVALGFLSIPVGMMMRFIPVEESPDSFFDNGSIDPLKAKLKPEVSMAPPNSKSLAVDNTPPGTSRSGVDTLKELEMGNVDKKV